MRTANQRISNLKQDGLLVEHSEGDTTGYLLNNEYIYRDYVGRRGKQVWRVKSFSSCYFPKLIDIIDYFQEEGWVPCKY